MAICGDGLVNGPAYDTYRLKRQAHRDEIRAILEQRGLDPESEEARAFAREFFADHPLPYSDVGDVADHIDHVVEVAGIDHVGLGSDFDGVGDSLPTGLKDVADYPNLIQVLLDRGYSETDEIF